MTKTKSYLIIALNTVIILTVILCLYFMSNRSLESLGFVGSEPISYRIFLFVNVIAAILLGIGSIAMIIAATTYLIQKRPALHFLKNAYILKMVATVWMSYVFVMTIFVRLPSSSAGQNIIAGEQSVLNIVLPIIAMGVFTFLEYKKTRFYVVFYSLIPQIVFMIVMLGAVYSGGSQAAIGREAPYIIFRFKTNSPVFSVLINIAIIVSSGVIGAGIYFANWTMFEKTYPRLATRKYQQQLLESGREV